MYCVILFFIIMQLLLFSKYIVICEYFGCFFFLKVRHVLFGVSGIAFAYNVTDKIVPGEFLSRLGGINFRIKEEPYWVWPKIYYLCKTSLLWPIFSWLWLKGNYVKKHFYWTIFKTFKTLLNILHLRSILRSLDNSPYLFIYCTYTANTEQKN